MCYSNEKINLPAFVDLTKPLNSFLLTLVSNPASVCRIPENIMFSKLLPLEQKKTQRGFMSTFKVQGQIYYKGESLKQNEDPRFLQLVTHRDRLIIENHLLRCDS